jgi:hypothetical protein
MPRITPVRTRGRNSRRRVAYWVKMGTFFAIVGSSIGGWLGWVVGAKIGFMSAYMLSVVGTAAGVYYGRRLYAGLLD